MINHIIVIIIIIMLIMLIMFISMITCIMYYYNYVMIMIIISGLKAGASPEFLLELGGDAALSLPPGQRRIGPLRLSEKRGSCSSGGSALCDICCSSVKALLVKCPSVQRQPDGLTIHTNKWFLGAGFLGAPPIALIPVNTNN